MPFLPVKRTDKSMDFILISADAYVDHPSFGHAIISRLVESMGFSIGIIPQPLTDSDYLEFGEPNIGILISGGVVDSMVNNYTVAKKPRSKDEYSEDGKTGMRPDRALTVYSHNARRLFGDKPIVIGGVEASLRRFAHYDYWADKVMPSILIDADADILIYGMGERPITEVLEAVKKGIPLKNIRDINGIAYKSEYNDLSKSIKDKMAGIIKFCPPFEEVVSNKLSYVKAFNIQNKTSEILAQKHGKIYVIVNPMAKPLSIEELDAVYRLPFMRTYHPMYTLGVPAIEEVKFSITSHRGCFGGCNYCSINYHQGRIIQKRSKESIIDEVKIFTHMPDFKGNVHDVGGPTANFRNVACDRQAEGGGYCEDKACIGFEPCKNLKIDHTEYLDILRSVREIEGVKRVFIRSGIRYDYLMYDRSDEFLNEIVKYHISGQLKVAPEHCSNTVLQAMNKAPFHLYKEFKERFMKATARAGKEQYLVPYFISSHPGATLNDAIKLAQYLKSEGYTPEQVQDFYPTPSTKSTTMYYTGINPDTMEEIYVPRDREEKQMQRALLQFKLKNNHSLVKAALIKAGRSDLIGYGSACLIKPFSEGGKIINVKENNTLTNTAPKKYKKFNDKKNK